MGEIEQLKERIPFLEQQMRDLRSQIAKTNAIPGWKRKAGLFAGDEAFEEIVRLGAKARRADRPKESPAPRA
jgi:cell division protein FtsB